MQFYLSSAVFAALLVRSTFSVTCLITCASNPTCTNTTLGANATCDTTTGCCTNGVTPIPAPPTPPTAATPCPTVNATASNARCVDLLNPLTGVSDCPSRASLCNDSVYYDVMTQQCPRTCNRCSGGNNSTENGSASGCVDLTNPVTGISDCPQMKAYCNNAIYKSLMQIQCPATCAFCTSG